jgi:DNA polymerase
MSKNPELPSALLWHLLYGKPRAHLYIDVESYSEAELNKVGAYRYWDDDSSEIELLSYAFDDEPVQTFDIIGGEKPPARFFAALTDPSVLKHAFNANFERLAFNSHYGIYCDPVQWCCTMVLGLSLGLPGSLEKQAAVLGMQHQKGDGRKAMMYFCKPCKPTKKNGMRARNLPHHDRFLWLDYKVYNKQDVEAERGLWKRLSKYNMQPRQWRAWAMDQRINDRGVRVDMELVNNAVRINDIIVAELKQKIIDLTGIKNPASVKQLLAWLNDAEGEEDKEREKYASDDFAIDKIEGTKKYYADLRKKTIITLLGDKSLDETIRRVLELRQLLAKSSVSKFRAMQRSVCKDGRIRGLLQFYGAPRTGRWAGRIVQVQNLPQNKLKDLALVRQWVKEFRLRTLRLAFGEGILQVLSELIRTAFIPAEGCRFIIADFSAIEARLAAWDTQEEWRLEVFRTHGMIYEASASEMFDVPLEDCMKDGKRSDLRARGKVSELALAYQGGPNALVTMGALTEGMDEGELLPTVKTWRKKSPRVTRNWYRTNDDALECVEYGTEIRYGEWLTDRDGEFQRRYGFTLEGGSLWQILPSGRRLCYPNARVEWSEQFERDQIVFDGVNQYTHQWGDIRTYGGKLFENRTQANGVDNLTNAMFRIEEEGIPIVFSVHDEPVMEVPLDWKAELANPGHKKKAEAAKSVGVKFIEALMCEEQPGYKGLPLSADGMDAMFYQK